MHQMRMRAFVGHQSNNSATVRLPQSGDGYHCPFWYASQGVNDWFSPDGSIACFIGFPAGDQASTMRGTLRSGFGRGRKTECRRCHCSEALLQGAEGEPDARDDVLQPKGELSRNSKKLPAHLRHRDVDNIATNGPSRIICLSFTLQLCNWPSLELFVVFRNFPGSNA